MNFWIKASCVMGGEPSDGPQPSVHVLFNSNSSRSVHGVGIESTMKSLALMIIIGDPFSIGIHSHRNKEKLDIC